MSTSLNLLDISVAEATKLKDAECNLELGIKPAFFYSFETNKYEAIDYIAIAFKYIKQTLKKAFFSYSTHNAIIFLLHGSNLFQCNLLLRNLFLRHLIF